MILLIVTLISISASANLTGPDNTPFTGPDPTSLTDPDHTSLTAPDLTALVEVKLSNATLSTTYKTAYSANKAIDGNTGTGAFTQAETNPWLRLYFDQYTDVKKVIIELGYSYSSSCTWTVAVYGRYNSTVCGTFTGKQGSYYNEAVDCGGAAGYSVMLGMTCTSISYLYILEIKVYSENLCGNITCQNNGTCDGTTGKCNCTNDYTGDRCENNKDRCWNTTCQNKGNCDSKTGKCNCTNGYKGDTCENEDRCWNITCQNKGTCDSTTGKCNCTNSYTGDTCENEDMCWNITCQNKGDCDSTTGKCNCPISYRGDSCQEKCDKKCRNGRVCYWRDPETQGCRCPGLSYGTGCSKKADCSLTERNICGRMKGNNPEKFTKKCKRNWGKKKCPTSCGYCRADEGVGFEFSNNGAAKYHG